MRRLLPEPPVEVTAPELDPELRERLASVFRPDVAQIEGRAGRSFGWEL